MLGNHLPLNCTGKLFFGSIPFPDEMPEIKKQTNAQAVWNLTNEMSFVLEAEQKNFSEVFHSPIDDYQAPDSESNFSSNLEEICLRLKDGKNVFVHCVGGHGRTGIALAACLIKINKMSAKIALSIAYKFCQGPESEKQKEFVRSLERNNARIT